MSAPFGRREVELSGRRELGPYVILTATDPQARARPGQFYMLAASARWGGGERQRPFLPRAMSAMSAGEDGSVEFLLERVGPGTARLCELAPGEGLLLAGPFGNGFTPAGPDALLVGGGVGIAPVLFAQREWGGRALVGFRDCHHAQAAALFDAPQIATDDGSVGHDGFVTDLLEAELAGGAPGAIFCCGPPAMLDAVRARVRGRAASAELALESPMACGYGACYGCVVQTVDGYRRVCVDGPVFAAAALA